MFLSLAGKLPSKLWMRDSAEWKSSQSGPAWRKGVQRHQLRQPPVLSLKKRQQLLLNLKWGVPLQLQVLWIQTRADPLKPDTSHTMKTFQWIVKEIYVGNAFEVCTIKSIGKQKKYWRSQEKVQEKGLLGCFYIFFFFFLEHCYILLTFYWCCE